MTWERSTSSRPRAARRRTSVPLGVAIGVADADPKQEAVELRLRQGIGALVLDRVLRGDDGEGRREQVASRPSTVTWRSCIASSSDAWVFGGARLISSPSTRLAKTGPGRNTSSPRRGSKIAEPVTSDGIRSGVNCTRGHRQPERPGERADDERLGQAGIVLEQDVAASQHPDQHEHDRVPLADDGALDLEHDVARDPANVVHRTRARRADLVRGHGRSPRADIASTSAATASSGTPGAARSGWGSLPGATSS